jgi:hypothetical protein
LERRPTYSNAELSILLVNKPAVPYTTSPPIP